MGKLIICNKFKSSDLGSACEECIINFDNVYHVTQAKGYPETRMNVTLVNGEVIQISGELYDFRDQIVTYRNEVWPDSTLAEIEEEERIEREKMCARCSEGAVSGCECGSGS